MEPGEIEFVGGSVDETPVLPAPARSPRLWRLLLVAALLAGGVAWAVTRHSATHSTATPTFSVPPDVPSAPASVITQDGPEVSFTCTDMASGCRVSRVDVATVIAAFKQHLPAARVSSINTTLLTEHGSGLNIAERILDAHIDSVDVLMRIRPYLHPEPAPTTGITPTPPGLGSAFFRFTTAAYVVDVQWTGTDANPPPVAQLQALADDPRLETIG